MRAGLLVLLLAAGAAHGQSIRVEASRAVMGSEFRVIACVSDAEAGRVALEGALDRVEALDRIFSDYDPESEVNRVSERAGSGGFVRVGDDFWTLLQRSLEWSDRTGGAFDVLLGSLTRTWRRAIRRGELPPRDDLIAALATSGRGHLEINASEQAVRFDTAGVRFDFGAIGKGYAGDQILAYLDERGIERALVDAGGDVVASGAPDGRTGWRVTMISADSEGRVRESPALLAHASLAASGETYRYLEVDGIRFSHIVDPATGYGVTTRRIVTVYASTGADADALASSLRVMLPDDGLALVRSLPETGAVIVSETRDRFREDRTGRLPRRAAPSASPSECTD